MRLQRNYATIGVEIGSARLKLAEMKNGELVNFLVTDLPENIVQNGNIVVWTGLQDFLKETLKENGFMAKRASLVLPDKDIYLKRLSMPMMSEDQLLVNLPYEFHDIVADNGDKYLFDYALIGMKPETEAQPASMEVMGAALSEPLLEQYKELFKYSGLKMVEAIPEYQAIGRVLLQKKQRQTMKKMEEVPGYETIGHLMMDSQILGEDLAVLDLGWHTTRIIIWKQGIYEVTRTIDMGLSTVVDVAADVAGVDQHVANSYVQTNYRQILDNDEVRDVFTRISIEVMRALNYYSYEYSENTLEYMYCCGGGAHIVQFLEELRDAVPLELRVLPNLGDEGEISLADGVASIGAAMGESGEQAGKKAKSKKKKHSK